MRPNWTWDKRSFKQSSRSQLSWTCARIACKSSTGRMRRIIWLQSTRFKWKQLTRQDVFSTLSKTISKDQTQCLSVTTLQPVTQTQSRTYAQYQMSRRHWCTIVCMSRTGGDYFWLHVPPCFSHLRSLQRGKPKIIQLRETTFHRVNHPTCWKRTLALHALWNTPRQPPTCLRSQTKKMPQISLNTSPVSQPVALPKVWHNTSKRIQKDRTKAQVKAIEPWQKLFGAVVRVHQDLPQFAHLAPVTVHQYPPTPA